MRMQFLMLLIILTIPFYTQAQECDCNEIFEWTKKTFEENDAGFSYIIHKKGQQAYSIHNKMIRDSVQNITDPIRCQNTIRKWLSFFRSAHVEFHYMGKESIMEKKKRQRPKNTAKDTLSSAQPTSRHARFLHETRPFIEPINRQTLYLRIPSFHPNAKKTIDSLIISNMSRITQVENLIIDIRNGTGGSDESYQKIMPLLYTNPIRMPNVEFLSTRLNNQRMYELATNSGIAQMFGLNLSPEERQEFRRYYDILSQHLGEFVNLDSEDVSITMFDTVYAFPQKVGILINEKNVSTDEQFLLEARQSKKVKLFGRTTRGGLDVSNLYLTYSPDKDFMLVYALSRSLRIPEFVVDDIGIKPDYYLDHAIPESLWINYVTKILNE
ncbi:MAG: hypothetical protein D6677_07870 [Calditrichaeota bacterium]|nr:MAG: hypothetical protein D6677_07870 [Calditrichota bacterium]